MEGVVKFPVAEYETHIQEGRHRLEVVPGELDRLRNRPYGKAQVKARVPEDVQELLRELFDPFRDAALVKEHEVDVRADIQLSPAVASEGDKRHVVFTAKLL